MSERDDQIQRDLNDAKRRQIEERYGGFFSPRDSSLPPDIESEWLESIAEFERQFASAEPTTVRHFIGDPTFIPVDDVRPEDLPSEVDRLLEYLEDHSVVIDFLTPVDDEEIYRFITEELLDEEVDNIHIEGMTHNFLYEEFHRNDALEISVWAEYLLPKLLDADVQRTHCISSPDGPLVNLDEIASCEPLLQMIERVSAQTASILDVSAIITESHVRGDAASVNAVLHWHGLKKDSMEPIEGEERLSMRFLRADGDEWPVTGFALDKPVSNSVF